MARALLVVGGIMNLAFALFHLALFRGIQAASGLAPAAKGLMLAFNVAGTLFIAFFALSSLLLRDELLNTRLGKATLALTATIYLSRASEEFFLFRFTPLIFAACAVVGVLYAAVLVMAMAGGGAAAEPAG
ncbi:MAG TPA: hypothetical protein VMT19_06335 [Thermoanaerobaculaceae bacterium]|nr:hypothetical protein [Thermoanaerobaculaceae bacterium]